MTQKRNVRPLSPAEQAKVAGGTTGSGFVAKPDADRIWTGSVKPTAG